MAGCGKVSVLSRFKGALVGGVVGDCIGAFFESLYVSVPIPELLTFIEEKIENSSVKKSSAVFTDDTAMARSVATSLIVNRGLNMKDMAERFVTEFYHDPERGYGANVGNVFKDLKDEDYKDVHGPASRQFDGSGSYGNGGGMRISPAALYGYSTSDDELDRLVTDVTRITHSHTDAINGAILQCAAVHSLLTRAGDEEFDRSRWLDDLELRMKKHEGFELESNEDVTRSPPRRRPKRELEEKPAPYCQKLRKIKDYLNSSEDPSLGDIEENIGTGIAALEACPAAVYSFARCTKEHAQIPDKNGFERTIVHAISLGGDTDTIATMAGAMAGALYGIESIPQRWLEVCEGTEDAIKSAERLWELIKPPTDPSQES